jgi:chemosensory pili system protein ChpE
MTIFLSAIFLGLIFNAAPGPVFAETLRRGLQGGYKSALAVQFGSLLGDASWALLGLLGIGLLLQLDTLRLPLGLAGATYLFYLAWDSWRSAGQIIALQFTQKSSGSAARSGALLSLSNPQNIAYWAAIGSALGSLGIEQPGVGDYAIYFFGFMLASVLWCFICAFLVNLLVRNLDGKWATMTYKACALAFFILALETLRSNISIGLDDRRPKALVEQSLD